MLSKILTVAIFVGLTLFPLIARADSLELSQAKETVQETALKLAGCSGIYSAVSDVHAATKAPALAKNTKEQSNGAWVASAYLLFSTGIISDWKNAMSYAENTASSTKLNYMASFEKPDVNKSIGELTEAMVECNKLLPFQDKLVQEVRLKVYSQNHQ